MGSAYVGEIRMFAGNFAPAGWMLCQGQTLPISEYETLFNLIGTTYGGDGQETFQLPNLQSRIPVHNGTGKGGTTYQIGEADGTESVTLTTGQMPTHTHSLMASGNNGGVSTPGNAILSNAQGATPYIEDTPGSNMNAAAISPVGGSQPHENRQPILAINFIISLYGVYPTQQ